MTTIIHRDVVMGDKIIGDKNVSNSLPTLNSVMALIERAKTVEALNAAILYAQSISFDSKDLIGLKSQLSSLSRTESLGIISYSEAATKRNQITSGLITMVKELFESSSTIQTSSFTTIQNQPQMVGTFNIITMRDFIDKFDRGIYPRTSTTQALIFNMNELAYNDAYAAFSEDDELFEAVIQVWNRDTRKARKSNAWDDIDELVNYIKTYSDSKGEALEESSKLNEKETLRKTAQNAAHTDAINAIDAFVQYVINHSVGDEKKQLAIDWKEDKRANILNNPFTRASRIKELKAKYLAL